MSRNKSDPHNPAWVMRTSTSPSAGVGISSSTRASLPRNQCRSHSLSRSHFHISTRPWRTSCKMAKRFAVRMASCTLQPGLIAVYFAWAPRKSISSTRQKYTLNMIGNVAGSMKIARSLQHLWSRSARRAQSHAPGLRDGLDRLPQRGKREPSSLETSGGCAGARASPMTTAASGDWYSQKLFDALGAPTCGARRQVQAVQAQRRHHSGPLLLSPELCVLQAALHRCVAPLLCTVT